MKKILALVLCALMLAGLAACGKDNAPEVVSSAPEVEEIATEEKEEEEEPEEEIAEQLATFGCNVDEMLAALEPVGEITPKFDNDLGDYYAQQFYLKGFYVLTYTEKESGEVAAYAIKIGITNKNGDVAGTAMAQLAPVIGFTGTNSELSAMFKESFSGPVSMGNIGCVTFEDDDDYTIFYHALGADLDVAGLSTEFGWGDEYFASNTELVQTLYDHIKAYEFDSALALVQEFIEENTPPADDPVYELAEQLGDEELAAALGKVTVAHDSVEDKMSVTYNGCESLSSSTNMIASLYGSDVRVFYGFHRGDWLFFDNIVISIDDGEKNLTEAWKSYNMERNVLGGGTVEEYAKKNSVFDQEEVLRIVNSDEATIRFYDDKKENFIDHTITDVEKDCLYSIHVLRWAYRDMSDIVYGWMKDA